MGWKENQYFLNIPTTSSISHFFPSHHTHLPGEVPLFQEHSSATFFTPNKKTRHISDSQSMAPRLSSIRICWSSLEIQILGLTPDLLNQNLCGWDPALCFNKASGDSDTCSSFKTMSYLAKIILQSEFLCFPYYVLNCGSSKFIC